MKETSDVIGKTKQNFLHHNKFIKRMSADRELAFETCNLIVDFN